VIAWVLGFVVWLAELVIHLLPILVAIAIIGLVVIAFKMLRNMPSTRPAKIRASEAVGVRWDDVAGLEEARAELEEVVDFLTNPKQFKHLGAKVPRGILLYGPPGTGKTLMAKAVAQESGATFFAVSASSFVEMFVGLGAARIRRLFSEARKNQPAIIFIDELDAVGTARGGHGNREHDQTLNQLLVELDGFDDAQRVIVIGASNRLEDLDAALLRPGRFDRKIVVSPPDVAGRLKILRVHTKDKPLAADVDLDAIARRSVGMTGAELANMCNEAAILAARSKRDQITDRDLDGAFERVVAGMQNRKLLTDKERRVVAYHEAGHTLLAHLMSDDIHRVTIVPRGPALGFMLSLPEEDRYMSSTEELEDWLKVMLGGRAAEEVVFGKITNGAENDLDRVTSVARAMVFEWGMGKTTRSQQLRADNYGLSEKTKQLRDREQRAIADRAYNDALRLVIEHREHLDRVALALLERETIGRTEVRELLADLEPVSNASREIGVEQPRDRAAAMLPADPLPKL
jgi:cell division protease FtsH